MRKHFVLDTNVLLHNPTALTAFADNVVVLPMTVIEELDRFKRHNDEKGRNARYVIRTLDTLRQRGHLSRGVPMDNGGVLMIVIKEEDRNHVRMDMAVADNRILIAAYNLAQKEDRVIFVSKDINARLKADALGLDVRDFEDQKYDIDSLYTGHRTLEVDGAMIDRLYKDGLVELDADLMANEFVLLADRHNPKHGALAQAKEEGLVVLLDERSKNVWQVRPRNKEQRMALELLMDPDIALVTLIGQAGTGKTLLALAAGLDNVLGQERYEKLLVSRPVIPLGKDIGFLPGSKDEKMSLWMQPIFDNLDFLLALRRADEDGGPVQQQVRRLLKDKSVELEALTYIRGRSISRQYVIIDEAQNLTPHEVKTIISRAGEGTKMVLTGDPYQIDNPYLDSSSNGLSYAVERLKDHQVCGHITLSQSERSQLSALAADVL